MRLKIQTVKDQDQESWLIASHEFSKAIVLFQKAPPESDLRFSFVTFENSHPQMIEDLDPFWLCLKATQLPKTIQELVYQNNTISKELFKEPNAIYGIMPIEMGLQALIDEVEEDYNCKCVVVL